MANLHTEKHQKKLYSDENLIKMLEADEINYTFAYNCLESKYPELKRFMFPYNYVLEVTQSYSYKAIFNCMLNSFIKMLDCCPYLCLLTGFKPSSETHELEKKYPELHLMPILDEYGIRDAEGNDITKLNNIYYDDNIPFHDTTLPYFTKFAKTLAKRHKSLYARGVLKEDFRPNELFAEMDNYLYSLNKSQQKAKKEKTEKLDKEL